MSAFGTYNASDPVSGAANFNPSWMGQTFNASSGVPRPTGRPNASNGVDGDEERPMAAPILMRNRYGREDILALYDGGAVHPPDGLDGCVLFQKDPLQPCVLKPLTELEKKLRENVNSSKAMSLLSATDRHHISAGGALPDSPQSAANRSNGNGWTHVPPRDHNKTWSRTSSTTSTTPIRGSVRGAFTGGRGGGTAGGGVDGTSPSYGGGGVPPQNGERTLGTGGTFPSRRGVNPVGRGGSSTANSFNSRAQGLYNPHDPSDRPRQRGRSTSEEAEGGAPPTIPSAAASAATTGGMGGQGNTWQSRQSAWGRSEQQRMPEWANDDDGGVGGGMTRDAANDATSGTFDDQGRFMSGRGPFPRGGETQNATNAHHDSYTQQQQQRVTPPSSVHTAAWGGSDERTGDVPHTTPIEIPSHSSSHYSMGSSAHQHQQQQQQQADVQGGVSGMSPSSTFLYALQQQQLQQQHYAAVQAQQPASPPKPMNFFYLDPSGMERGPFTQEQMEAWFTMGYFQSTLEVRRECDTGFTALGDLQKRNGSNPFKFIPEPVPAPAPAPVMPTPGMLAGYMEHQMGLGNAGNWEQQSVQSIFGRVQTTPSYEALLEKQRMEEQARRLIEEREHMIRMQEMMQRQAETEREKKERELKEKEMEIQRKHEEMLLKEREIEAAKRQHELILAEQQKAIEKKRIELEMTKTRELAEKKAKEEEEQRKREEMEEKKRMEEQRRAAEEEAEREKERSKKRAEEAKRLMEEEKKRQEAERKMAEAFAKAEELRLEAEREQAAEKERQAQIAAARKAAVAPVAPAASAWEVATPNTSGNTTPIVLPKVSSGPAWGGAGLSTASPSKKMGETRSLAQVMAEEERQARAEARENERMRREVEAAAPKSKAGVWGGVTPSSIASQATPSGPLAWGGAGVNNGPAKPSPWAGPSLSEANKPKAAAKPAAAPQKTKVVEKKKEEKKKAVSDEASFISWFIGKARQLNETVDGEVLATFIQDISNPDEVEDYMIGYLGEGKQVKEFVREYIHKRSEMRNKAKGTVAGPSHDASSNDGFSSVGKKSAQKKKAKFVVDSACLGFRPTGDPNRVNQGEIDHPEVAAGRR